MKVLAPNYGVIERERIYSSCLITNAYILDGTEKKFYFLFEYIPALKLFCTYSTQGNWQLHEGDVYNTETQEAVDFSKERTFQNYILINNQVVNCELLEFCGELELKETTEYLYHLKKGKYKSYFYSTEYASSAFGWSYLLLDDGKLNQPVFRVIEKDGFYCFELTPACLVCWKTTESIDNYFVVNDRWQDLSVAHRKHKISSLTIT